MVAEQDVIPDGEHCPIAIVLLNVEPLSMLARSLSAQHIFTDEYPILPLDDTYIDAIAHSLTDMVVFTKNVQIDSCYLFERIAPEFTSQHYILHGSEASIVQDLSLSRCPENHQSNIPLLPSTFQSSQPTPGVKNACPRPSSRSSHITTAGNSGQLSNSKPVADCRSPANHVTAGQPMQRTGGKGESTQHRSGEPPTKKQKTTTTDHDGSSQDMFGEDENGEKESDQHPAEHGDEELAPKEHETKCFMSEPSCNKDVQVPCSGELTRLSQYMAIPPPELYSTGAVNMADLILSRGDGLFHWHNMNLDEVFVCEKHGQDLGTNWWNKRSQMLGGTKYFIGRRAGKSFVRCLFLEKIEDFEHNHGTVEGGAWVPKIASAGQRGIHYVSKEESELLWIQKEIFIPMGTRNECFFCFVHAS